MVLIEMRDGGLEEGREREGSVGRRGRRQRSLVLGWVVASDAWLCWVGPPGAIEGVK